MGWLTTPELQRSLHLRWTCSVCEDTWVCVPLAETACLMNDIFLVYS